MGLLWAIPIFHLSFCNSNIINHFYCDDVALIDLACHKMHYKDIKEVILFTPACFKTFVSLFIVLFSYIFVIFAILRINSAEGRQNAFSICASRLTSITIFYGTIICIYMKPKTSHSLNADTIAPVFYIVVILC